jgi:aminomethyltransferase
VSLHSPLHKEHERLGATMVDFAGWQMPLRYTGDTAEHVAVRQAAGLFDLSHMAEVMVRGPQAAEALDYATVGRLSAVKLWGAKYTMLCHPEGGVVDDLVVYRRDWDHFMVVANAANRETVVDELVDRLDGFDAWVEDFTPAVALIALQGPAAVGIVRAMCELGAEDVESLRYYSAANVLLVGGIHAFVARTGYTGEDGFELYVNAADAVRTWRLALALGEPAGLVPAGLSARDTLRLEAGMPLYGHELSRDTNPIEAGLGRIIQWGSDAAPRGDFVGRPALDKVREQGPMKLLTGLVGTGKRSARTGYAVMDDADNQVGIVTSGAPSPTLGVPIAMAYVPPALATPGTVLHVDVRGRHEQMTTTALPFYQREV